MIRMLLRLPLALVCAIPGVWMTFWAWGSQPRFMLEEHRRVWMRAFPLGESHGRLLQMEPFQRSPNYLEAAAAISKAHLEASIPSIVFQALLVLAGLLGGLALRERLRSGDHGYASLTAAAIGRALVGGGLFWGFLFSVSPLPLDYGWLYACGILAGPGAFLYIANLPVRL